jgi:hypothetical protein
MPTKTGFKPSDPCDYLLTLIIELPHIKTTMSMEFEMMPMHSKSPETFTPEHYGSWAWHIQAALEERELWDIVASEEKAPTATDVEGLATYNKKERRAKSLIAMMILLPYSNEVQTLKTAKEIWDYMASNYKERGLLRWMELSKKYHMMQKSPSMTADEYIRIHKTTHDELREIIEVWRKARQRS